MIEIWEPRYKDMSVLVATSKIIPGRDTEIKITKGKYTGNYTIPSEVISECHIERKPTKSGYLMEFTIVPFNKLIERKDNAKI